MSFDKKHSNSYAIDINSPYFTSSTVWPAQIFIRSHLCAVCTQVITQKRLLTPIEMTERFPRFFVRVFTKRESEEYFPFLANFRSRCRNVA